MTSTVRNPAAAIALAMLVTATTAIGPLPAARAAEQTTPTGITWPSDHALPTFARAEHLDAVAVGSQPPDAKALFATLQGLVNRRRPRVYLLGRAGEGKTTWLEALHVPYSTLDDPWQLVTRYRSEIKGVVVTDPNVPASINVATTLAGLDGDVVASPRIADRLTNEFHLPIATDLRGRFGDDLAADSWEVDNLWPRTTHRMLVGIGPGEVAGLRDYPVATEALAIWLRVGVQAERALWERLLRDIPPNSPYVGWFDTKDKASGELPGVWFLSEHGMYDVAGDLFGNMTVFSGVPAPSLSAPQATVAPPALGAKIYVAFVQSDGDNPQYLQHRMRMVWDDPQRGRVPLNWTVNPLLADCAPALLAYYRKTATANDYLIAGPSGGGVCVRLAVSGRRVPRVRRRDGALLRAHGHPGRRTAQQRPGRGDADPAGQGRDLRGGRAPARRVYVRARLAGRRDRLRRPPVSRQSDLRSRRRRRRPEDRAGDGRLERPHPTLRRRVLRRVAHGSERRGGHRGSARRALPGRACGPVLRARAGREPTRPRIAPARSVRPREHAPAERSHRRA